MAHKDFEWKKKEVVHIKRLQTYGKFEKGI